MKRIAALLALFLVAARAEEKVFFAFDDQSIPWRSNLKLTMVTADKHPANPVLEHGSEGAPDHGHAVMYGSVLHVGGKFRMWYLGMIQTTIERGQAPGWWRPMCYAESDDGVHWTKPALGLVELNGSKQNNICLVESEPFSLSRVNDFLTVMHEPDEPDPAKRYKCAFIAHVPFDEVKGGRSAIGPDEKRWGAFICATSADGLSWKVVGDHPMNAGGERFEVSGLYHFNGFYYATGQLISPWIFLPDGREIGRAMRTYRSADFAHWDQTTALGFARPGQMLAQPVKGQQTHMGAGIWNRGNVLLGLYGQWQDGAATAAERREVAPARHAHRSRLHHEQRRHPLARTRARSPDHRARSRGRVGQHLAAASPRLRQRRRADLPVGIRTGIVTATSATRTSASRTLRRDGFGYLSALKAEAPATCETTFFEAGAGAKLYVNAQGVSADAPLKIELLDERLHVIGSATVTKSGTHVEALALPKSRVAARVSFGAGSAAKLYALYLETN